MEEIEFLLDLDVSSNNAVKRVIFMTVIGEICGKSPKLMALFVEIPETLHKNYTNIRHQ